eukprot:CAMPEP_0181355060 /NCGR_PEP_ID=MMETSP1106-20121128/3693_1 /TAXON_ID=81844 /ORGANISM="Mantoniella antarctica, Strain SL-175" /LENGTH=120 /DNA_ID=CAMNT_0023467765 /DNA_START=57 /DNA_END=419 /DNA_ORIENTATION=+
MAEATKAGGGGGGGGGWLYGNKDGGISMEGLTGDAAAAAEGAAGSGSAAVGAPAAVPMKTRALTAGGVRMGKKTATVLRGITKRKKKKLAKGIAVRERVEGKLKKNTAKIGIRLEGKTLY